MKVAYRIKVRNNDEENTPGKHLRVLSTLCVKGTIPRFKSSWYASR